MSGFADDLLRGKVIAVTGAGHGIGLATLLAAANLGASVVALEINPQHLQEAQSRLDQPGATSLGLLGDVGDDGFLRSAIDQIGRRFGRLDGWVNNAYSTTHEPIDQFDAERFTQVWKINVRVPMEAAALTQPLFAAAGGGAIVNIGSVLARRVRSNEYAYASSKAALEGLTRVLAYDLAATKVRVNCVLPGAIRVDENSGDPSPPAIAAAKLRDLMQTHFQPLRQIGRPQDIADTVIFLLSDLARFITGVSLPVDGGFLIDGTWIGSEPFAQLMRDADALRAGIKQP